MAMLVARSLEEKLVCLGGGKLPLPLKYIKPLPLILNALGCIRLPPIEVMTTPYM